MFALDRLCRSRFSYRTRAHVLARALEEAYSAKVRAYAPTFLVKTLAQVSQTKGLSTSIADGPHVCGKAIGYRRLTRYQATLSIHTFSSRVYDRAVLDRLLQTVVSLSP